MATVSGIAFTLVFFILFQVSERDNPPAAGAARARRAGPVPAPAERGLRRVPSTFARVASSSLVRDYNNLEHLRQGPGVDPHRQAEPGGYDRPIACGPDTGYQDLDAQRLFSDYEQQLFTRVVALAEKEGKHVDLIVVPSTDFFQAAVMTAAQLDSWDLFAGISEVMTPEEQARRMGEAWEGLPEKPAHRLRYRIVDSSGEVHDYLLGAHAPALTDEDIAFLHRIWLDVASQPGKANIHHRDVVSVALAHLWEGLSSPERDHLLAKFGVRQARDANEAARRLASQSEARR